MGIETKPLIAIDMDDVLCQTNASVAEWHNETYGTNMNPDLFYYYHYWKNPYWGTALQVFQKIPEFYRSSRFINAPPVLGAAEALQGLRDVGYRLIIVTARSKSRSEQTEEWLDRWFKVSPKPLHLFAGIFESIHYTDAFTHLDSKGVPQPVKKSKAMLCKELGAVLLIDDSLENCIVCNNYDMNAIIFGGYEWGKRHSTAGGDDAESYAERLVRQPDERWWENDIIVELPGGVVRLGTWGEVVAWVHKNI